ncbi:MAG: GNAT family N-acetyltransferase [Gaiellales bacterium]
MTELLTPRLRLRQWRDDDLEPFAAMNALPEVTRYLSGPVSREMSDERARLIQDHWRDRGFGLWAAELRDEGRFIGFVGLSVPAFLPAVLPAVEVGWRLAPDVWGRGLATEGGRASIEYGFGALQLDRIISIIHPGNIGSLRVAEKLDMTLAEMVPHPPMGGQVCVYERLSRRTA